MAISKDKKQALVAEMGQLFADAKSIAVAKYQGTSVADLQELRRAARENNVVVKVVKNRLVRVAFAGSETFKETDTSALQGQLIYAISSNDEVMPAKILNDFAKTHPTVELIAGFSNEGLAQSTADVVVLASLPGKNQLIAETVEQLLSPVHDVVNALSGNLHALLDGVETKAT